MHRLHRVELLILDDLALHRLEATETGDFYELIVERHRHASTITTSNREPPKAHLFAQTCVRHGRNRTGYDLLRSASRKGGIAARAAREVSPI